MQVTPALPWGTTTEGGVIKLKKAVTYQDLLDGILRWTLDKNETDEVGQVVAGEVGDRNLYVANTRGDKVYTIEAFTDPTTQLSLTRHADAPADTSLKSAVFPAVIAPQGDVQIFNDLFGYELATGTLSKVYVRINKPWVGDDSGWVIGSPNMENAAFSAISPSNGSGSYNFYLWVDWTSEERNTPYEAGQMVEVSYGAGDSLNITTYETDFEKPLYIEGLELSDSYKTLKPDGSVAGSGEVGAIIGGLIGTEEEEVSCFFTQDGSNAIGGEVSGDQTILISSGTYQTNSVLNTAEKPVSVEVGIKVKILKTGYLQVLYSNNYSNRPYFDMITRSHFPANIGYSAPICIISAV